MTKRELFRGEHPITTYVRRPTWRDILGDAVVLILAVVALYFIWDIGVWVGF